jgi:hypothetical protein
MVDIRLETEELGLIYGNSLVVKSPDVLEVAILVNGKSASVTFSIPRAYPDEIPRITADIAGVSGAPLEKFLTEQAQTMAGLTMLAYLVGEARDFLAGAAGKEIFEQQEHITQTPFSRDRFLLWLDGFLKEKAAAQAKVKRPLTGRQMFERGLVKPNT